MARRNKKGQFVKGSGGGGRRSAGRTRVVKEAITVRMQAPAPAKKRRSSSTRVVHVAAPRRRSVARTGGGAFGGLAKLVGGGHRAPIMVGALALGFANQHGWLQKLPLLGKAGPITSAALLGWGAEELLHVKLPQIAHDAITAGLCISAFNIGNTMGSAGGTQLVGDGVYPGGAVFFE
jgi:hypothetical protein